MELEEIKELMALLEESSLKKLMIKRGDFEVLLEKETHVPVSYHEREPVKPSVSMETRAEIHEEGKFVTSPMVGTFYASPSPDHPSFVKPGDRVEEGTVMCIIEAMKVMNEVKAGIRGVVKEILIGNSEPVEFGTKLFRIE